MGGTEGGYIYIERETAIERKRRERREKGRADDRNKGTGWDVETADEMTRVPLFLSISLLHTQTTRHGQDDAGQGRGHGVRHHLL